MKRPPPAGRQMYLCGIELQKKIAAANQTILEQQARIEQLETAAKPSLELLKEYFKEIGGCDHSVGLCMCEDIRVADRLQEALETPSDLSALREHEAKVLEEAAKYFCPKHKYQTYRAYEVQTILKHMAAKRIGR
jgi:hypothetical protein